MLRYLPSLFDDDFGFMDSMMDSFDRSMKKIDRPLFGRHADRLMKTDIREKDGHYELDVELPGFKKEDLQLTLQDGYLLVHAEKSLDKDKKHNDKVLRQERYSGVMERSFYLGDQYEEADIKAEYKNGVLAITLPKKEEQEKLEPQNRIAIE